MKPASVSVKIFFRSRNAAAVLFLVFLKRVEVALPTRIDRFAVGRLPTAFEFLQVFGREVHIDRAVVWHRDEAAVRVERENRAHVGGW